MHKAHDSMQGAVVLVGRVGMSCSQLKPTLTLQDVKG